MKLSISNIAWSAEEDNQVYALMKRYGYEGLEIAPTRIFPIKPYDHIEDAKSWAKYINEKYGFMISSMQSIWFGRKEKIFGSSEEREILLEYTKKAIDFAESIGCGNLVFGCPQNRMKPDSADETIAIKFFKEIGDYAADHNTVIGIEANPPIYNTNFINDTVSAISLIKEVDSSGLRLNLDIGTMIENEEDINIIENDIALVNHVHISEPGLTGILNREFHRELFSLLNHKNYNGFVSIEIDKSNVGNIEEILRYVRKVLYSVECKNK